jgi:hypothetical protein
VQTASVSSYMLTRLVSTNLASRGSETSFAFRTTTRFCDPQTRIGSRRQNMKLPSLPGSGQILRMYRLSWAMARFCSSIFAKLPLGQPEQNERGSQERSEQKERAFLVLKRGDPGPESAHRQHETTVLYVKTTRIGSLRNYRPSVNSGQI